MLVALLLVGFGLLLFRPDKPATVAAAPTPAATDTGAASTGVPSAPAPSTPDAATSPQATTEQPTAEPPTIAAAPVEATQPVTTAPAATAPESTPADTSTPATGTPAATDQTGATTTATPRSGGAVATSERRVPLRSDYRITLGTFGTVQAANSASAPVGALGYTVYPIDLGSQVVAQIGPFADEASARQALADIQRAYPRAILYPPRNQNSSQTTSSPSTTSSSSSTTATPRTPAAAPSGPTYLQVGAFDRVESAQKLVQQLRDLGYTPTVNAPDGKKVTVLVGPYTGDAVSRTEGRLSSSGLDHFRVR